MLYRVTFAWTQHAMHTFCTHTQTHMQSGTYAYGTGGWFACVRVSMFMEMYGLCVSSHRAATRVTLNSASAMSISVALRARILRCPECNLAVFWSSVFFFECALCAFSFYTYYIHNMCVHWHDIANEAECYGTRCDASAITQHTCAERTRVENCIAIKFTV